MTLRLCPGRLAVALWIIILQFALVMGAGPRCLAKEQLAPGSSSRKHRTEAIEAIPFDKLNDAAVVRIRDVVTHPSFYRRLPVESIDADPDYFRYLIRKPEVVVSIWQLMGVTQMTTQRLGPYMVKTDDGAGTISNLELVYGDSNLHLFYGTGSYEGPVFRRKLTGRCVIVVRTEAQPDPTGGFALTNQLDVFLRVDNATAALVTKTIQPIVGNTADHNFTESLKFIERLNTTTRNNGPGVKAMGDRLALDDQTQQSFHQIVDTVFERAYRLGLQVPGGRESANGPVVAATSADSRVELYRPSSPSYNYFAAGQSPAASDSVSAQSGPILRTQSPAAVNVPLNDRTLQRLPRRRPQQPAVSQPQRPAFVPQSRTIERIPTAGVSVLEGGPRPSLTQQGDRYADRSISTRFSDR